MLAERRAASATRVRKGGERSAAGARAASATAAVDLLLPNGEHWRLSASGAAISLEESLFMAHPAGSRPTEQIVLRGVCGGSCEVTWVVERTDRAEPAQAAMAPEPQAEVVPESAPHAEPEASTEPAKDPS